jgi:hypothetical protein
VRLPLPPSLPSAGVVTGNQNEPQKYQPELWQSQTIANEDKHREERQNMRAIQELAIKSMTEVALQLATNKQSDHPQTVRTRVNELYERNPDKKKRIQQYKVIILRAVARKQTNSDMMATLLKEASGDAALAVEILLLEKLVDMEAVFDGNASDLSLKLADIDLNNK